MKQRILIILAIAALAFGVLASEVKLDSDSFGGVRARAIGSATMSGRITAIQAVRSGDDPLTVWVGAASGGVWKSIDGGTSFRPVFDDYPQSIGAIAIDPANPKNVWVGTGESNTRNTVPAGKGVFRTTDGGENWTSVGLVDTEHVGALVVSPASSDTAYVCAVGHLWNDNEERGVFKTTDAGKTWEKVLYVDQTTGCADLATDPGDPDILYAAMWHVRRSPDFFVSGGPGSGLYKSVDAGKTWKKLTKGLPDGDLGRIGIGIARTRPSTLYAVVEAKKSALYRSDDFGETWTKTNDSFNVQARPFYFARVVVDPNNLDRVYKPGFFLTSSSDGGKTFSSMGFGGSTHPDHHALWIDPEDSNHMFLGTDGGVYISRDRGNHWSFVRSLPVSQFYHVGFDMEWPYNVYGGLQDNGTWTAPSRSPGGIEVRDWTPLFGGDGFHAYPDVEDSNLVYLEYQGGNISRVNKVTGETKDIKPLPVAGDPDYRFNWNTPIFVSHKTPGTIYVGAQFLFRSRDRGDSWEKISPDLTTNDPKRQRQKQSGGLSIDNTTAENNTTIYAIQESTLDDNVVWAGTDDGNLQLTRDGGKTWTNVAKNVPGVPAGTWVSSIEASHYDKASAYVTFDGHRSGDMKTYVYRTSDFGQTWQSIATDDIEGFAWVCREDLVNRALLFVGTEFGLYISVDSGQNWARFKGGVPKVPVHDMAIQPRDGDLLIATHGRGIYILDDLTPLRKLTADVIDSDVAMLPSRDAIMMIGGGGQSFSGDEEFVGRNPPDSAQIVYYLKKRHMFGDLRVEVLDKDGNVVTTLPGERRRGINRVDWPMRLKAPKVPPANSLVPAFEGPRMLEGTYTARLVKGDKTYETTVSLVPDPRSKHSAEDRIFQQTKAMEIYRQLERLTYIVETMIDVRDQAKARAEGLEKNDGVRKNLDKYVDKIEKLRGVMVNSLDLGPFADNPQLREKLGELYGGVNGYDGRPTKSQLDRMVVLFAELDKDAKSFETLTTADLAPVNRQLEGRKLAPLKVMTREEWKAKDEKGGAGTTSVARDVEGVEQFSAHYPHFQPFW